MANVGYHLERLCVRATMMLAIAGDFLVDLCAQHRHLSLVEDQCVPDPILYARPIVQKVIYAAPEYVQVLPQRTTRVWPHPATHWQTSALQRPVTFFISGIAFTLCGGDRQRGCYAQGTMKYNLPQSDVTDDDDRPQCRKLEERQVPRLTTTRCRSDRTAQKKSNDRHDAASSLVRIIQDHGWVDEVDLANSGHINIFTSDEELERAWRDRKAAVDAG
ncbi:hypothetical protein V8E55_001345 [Tylopilus felleus]